MKNEEKVFETLQPLTDIKAAPENGAKPIVQPEIEKTIQLTELQQDLSNLQCQAFVISGAIQYIQQKIAALNKVK